MEQAEIIAALLAATVALSKVVDFLVGIVKKQLGLGEQDPIKKSDLRELKTDIEAGHSQLRQHVGDIHTKHETHFQVLEGRVADNYKEMQTKDEEIRKEIRSVVSQSEQNLVRQLDFSIKHISDRLTDIRSLVIKHGNGNH